MSNSNRAIRLKPLMFAIVGTTILLIFVLLALLLAPQPSIPEFDVAERDWNGIKQWEGHGRIAVFDEKIQPGAEGSYDFIITNESDTELRFGITFTEYLNTQAPAHPFMEYRLKMNGDLLGDGKWHTATGVGVTSMIGMDYQELRLLPTTSQLYTLEWRWQFETDDENDTLIGIAGGQLSIHCLILAEVINK